MESAQSEEGRRTYARRAAKKFLQAVGITFLLFILSGFMPQNLVPYLASGPLCGLLLGPFGALGTTALQFLMNVMSGYPMEMSVLDVATTFVCAYLPYRMWYAGRAACEQPSMNNVRDIAKLFSIAIVTSVVFTILYHYSYIIMLGEEMIVQTDIADLVSVLTFTLILGMCLILLFKHRGIHLYTPHSRFMRDDIRRRVNPAVFDIALVAAVLVGALGFYEVLPMTPAMAATYVLLALFLIKPITASGDGEVAGIGRYDFDTSIIERIIVIFVVIGIIVSVISGIGAYNGVLLDVLGLGASLSATFYIGITCLGFFSICLIVLYYIERRISVPLSEISGAARGFVEEGEGISTDETIARYERYQDYDSEIGVLARSLTDMTRDIETYVDDIRTLNTAKEMYTAELTMARSIQGSFIPRDFESVSPMGVEVSGEMLAAKYVGGDFYDFFRVDDNHVAMAVGDVSGKGMPAALLMAVTRSLLRSHVSPGSDPGEVLRTVNEYICDGNDQGMFVTAWLGIMDVRTGMVEFANAGHCRPVLIRSGSPAELLCTRAGLVLGGRSGTVYRREELVLSPGDRIVLYTDGVTEANDDYTEFYGDARLLRLVDEHAGEPVDAVVRAVVDDVLRFTGDSEQFDDITLFAMEYRRRGPM